MSSDGRYLKKACKEVIPPTEHSERNLQSRYAVGAVLQDSQITPNRRWLFALMVVYGCCVTTLGGFKAALHAYAFLLGPFLVVIACVLPSLMREGARLRKDKLHVRKANRVQIENRQPRKKLKA